MSGTTNTELTSHGTNSAVRDVSTVASGCDVIASDVRDASAPKMAPVATGAAVAGSSSRIINPQLGRLRQTLVAAGVQDSMDDDEMREYDVEEHRETLGAGIPSHLAQKTGPSFIKPRHMDSTDDEANLSATEAYISATGLEDSSDEYELSPISKSSLNSRFMTSQVDEVTSQLTSSIGGARTKDVTASVAAVGGVKNG